MSDQFPELDQARVVVDEVTRESHLVAVSAALRARGQGSRGRGRVLVVALVLVLLVPVIALAAENTVPGDFLYPIKRAVEPVVQVFDSDAPAQRRVREVEMLFERDAPDAVIVPHVDEARDVISDSQPALIDRIDRVVHDLDTRRSDRLGVADDPPNEPGDERPANENPLVPADQPDREHETRTTSTTVEETTDTTRQGDSRGDG